jgi:adenosylmethionine-8-amino-7-oxononanoate aminotransferase
MIKNKTLQEPYPWQQRRGLQVYRHALAKGVLLRPLGNVIYFMPPYVISEEELHFVANTAWDAIQLATQD